MAYFMLRDREDYLQEELSEYEEHIIDQGNLIGEKARGLFTDRAVMISETNGDAAGGGWKLIEVKSAGCDTSDAQKIEEKKNRYSPDAAYTLMLMSACGVEVSGVSLMAVSKDYRKGRPDGELFVTIDIAVEHFDYIVKPDFDCRRELIEKLIVELDRAGDNGSIVVYSPFENSRIGEAIKRFPDLAPQLKAIQKRIFDLLVFLKDNYYHPDFHGSYSIKKTLPALVPDLKYDGLAVKNGGEAIVHLHKIVTGELTPDEYQQTRADLLAYCRLDTLAMAALHEKLMHAG